jgi:acyl-homoserine-lactone acylase
MHPKKKYYYEYDGKWEKLDVRTAWLKVKIKGFVISVPKKTYWSKYGATFQSGKNKKEFYSVRFTANQDIRAAQQWYYMDKAKNFDQFHTALKDIGIVRFNIVYADRDDNIFYISNGRIPVRPKGYKWDGVVPGNTSKTLWTETYPLDSLPQLLNPSCGYVYNTNNSEFYATGNDCNDDSSKFCRDMGFWYGNNNRAYRAFELTEKQEKFTWDEFKTLKFDQTFPATSKFFKSLKPLFNLDTLKYADLGAVVRKINKWDYSCAATNSDATLPLIAIKYIFKIKHYGQEELEKGIFLPDSVYALALRYSRDLLLTNFKTIDVPLGTVQRLQRGNVDMPVGGAPDVLAALHTEPLPGGREKAVGGDTYVQLVRFTKDSLPHIESLLPLGNSARPDSPHFTDQMELYTKQQTKTMTLDKATIFRDAERIYHPK